MFRTAQPSHKQAHVPCLAEAVLAGPTFSDTTTAHAGPHTSVLEEEFRGPGLGKIIGQQTDRPQSNQAEFIQVAERQT